MLKRIKIHFKIFAKVEEVAFSIEKNYFNKLNPCSTERVPEVSQKHFLKVTKYVCNISETALK